MTCTTVANDPLWSELQAAKATRASDRQRYVAARNALLELHYGLCRSLASRLKRKLPACITLGEVESAAVDGLLHAVENFNPARNIRFVTYASRRIWGAMQDWLRQQDVLSRRDRRQQKLADVWEQELGRSLTADELEQVHTRRRRNPRVGLTPADLDRSITWPTDRVALHNLSPILRGLNKRQRLLLLLYYVEGMRFQDIGVELGCSESHVSQMHGEILYRLITSAQRAG